MFSLLRKIHEIPIIFFYDAPSFLQKNSNIENFGSSFSSATIQWHDIFRSLNLNCILMKLQVFIKHALVRKRRHDSVGWNLRSSRMEIKAFLCKPLQRFQSKPLEIRRFKGRSIVINKIILKNCIEKVIREGLQKALNNIKKNWRKK